MGKAAIHRDYFTSASIRILVLADRVEIASPGHLPDSLSVEAIRQGRTNRRNPTLTEHAAQILPYRSLGSGIPRALREWPRIELIDDVAGNQFSALAWRPEAEWAPVTGEVTSEVTPPLTGEVTGEVKRLLDALQGEMKRADLQVALGLRHEDHFRDAYLKPALEAGLIEMTLPEKPRSFRQKYRLTAQGQAVRNAARKNE